MRKWSLVPHLDAAASGCTLATAEFPQLQGTVMAKLSKLIVEAPLPNLTERWEVMSLYMQAYTSPLSAEPVSSSHIEAQFVWANWKVLSCELDLSPVPPLSSSRFPYFLNMTEFKSFSRWSALCFLWLVNEGRGRVEWMWVEKLHSHMRSQTAWCWRTRHQERRERVFRNHKDKPWSEAPMVQNVNTTVPYPC